ncbi:hypothetical protein CIL03_11290 [Virgibacillus indicus]|uniref:Uncharacterized protein n=1 Tax=Virgibacillus indicus TaxID=2024554 RepID=A0A265N8U4_9BACI|nr:hypothetical protein [Virgibacillus indicus]OZU88231.1 hypothetical protein CIL03_11290 [Virgibacillus indicus]
MDFDMNYMIPTISLTISIPTALYLVIKIIYRTKIEMVLEDKYKNKINQIIEIVILSMFLATLISIGSYMIEKVPNFISNSLPYILLVILLIFTISFVVQLIALAINEFREIKKKKCLFNFYKVIFIIEYLSILLLNGGLLVLNERNLELNEIILTVITFGVMYMMILIIFRFSFNQVKVKSKDYYEVTLINENINETLKELILLYTLNKKLLIMKEKLDEEKDINDLKVFYVYYFQEGFVLKYKEHFTKKENIKKN